MNGESSTQTKLHIKLLLLSFTVLMCLHFQNAQAALSCPASQQITQQFDNGASWAMCWESKQRENLVLSEVQYTPSNGTTFNVFSSLRLSQLHVAYDDSNVTYFDVTQFGLGAGYISPLDNLDCPNGELIDIAGKQGLCKQLSDGNDSYHTANEHRLSQSLSLFSVSQVGSYAYLVTWKFFANGSVQPSVGAAGALQRSADLQGDDHNHNHEHNDSQTDNSTEGAADQYGRQLSGSPDKVWLSHTHNYYWRIDFDLGANATNDRVSELNYIKDSLGRTQRETLTFNTEVARSIMPESQRAWVISSNNEDPMTAPGFIIEPIHAGHKLIRRELEPYTEYDFFVTKQKNCERFATQNALYNPDCKANILQFVDDENIVDEDIVVWHRVSFHHVPRNEDRVNMHSHWDGFVMQSRNLSSGTPGHSGNAADITLASNAFANDDQSAPTQDETQVSETHQTVQGKSGFGAFEWFLLLLLTLYYPIRNK